MRGTGRIALLAATVVTGGCVATVALAADETVQARDNFFSPGSVTVNPGDTLTIRHAGNNAHALQFEDEATPRQLGGTNWVETREMLQEDIAKSPITFICDLHENMTGSVRVTDQPIPTPSGTPNPTPTKTPTSTPTPTPTPDGSPSPSPGPSDPGPEVGDPGAALQSARMDTRRFCTRRNDDCRRPGVRLSIDLDRAAEVKGTVTRRKRGRFRRFGKLDFGEREAGSHSLRFRRTEAGRLLRPGSYKLTLRVGDVSRTFSFRVRR